MIFKQSITEEELNVVLKKLKNGKSDQLENMGEEEESKEDWEKAAISSIYKKGRKTADFVIITEEYIY